MANWDWKKLLVQLIPIIVSWVLGALGVGPSVMTPDRVLNKPAITAK